MRSYALFRPVAVAFLLAGSVYAMSAFADQPISGPGLNTPESPASTLVGASTQGITHPGSPTEAGLSLLNGLDVNGNLKTGVGIEATPALLLMPLISSSHWITYEGYRANPWERLAARTSLSVATAKGATNSDQSVAVATGLRSTFFDASDILLDSVARSCAAAAESDAAKFIASNPPTQPGRPFPTDDIQKAYVSAKKSKCMTQANDRNWNRSSWNWSAADSYVSPTGATNALKQQTFEFNSTLAWGFDNFRNPCDGLDATQCSQAIASESWIAQHAQLVLGLQYQDGMLVPTPKKQGLFYSQDAWQVGVQLRLKPWSVVSADPSANKSSKLGQTLVSVEAIYARDLPEGMPRTSDYTIITSAEFAISDTIFLDMGVGVDRKQTEGKNTALALTQFKWNFGNKSSLFGS